MHTQPVQKGHWLVAGADWPLSGSNPDTVSACDRILYLFIVWCFFFWSWLIWIDQQAGHQPLNNKYLFVPALDCLSAIFSHLGASCSIPTQSRWRPFLFFGTNLWWMIFVLFPGRSQGCQFRPSSSLSLLHLITQVVELFFFWWKRRFLNDLLDKYRLSTLFIHVKAIFLKVENLINWSRWRSVFLKSV